VVLFGGDFRQILPIVIVGYRSQTVWKSLKMSPLWNRITLQLTTNMRLQVFKTSSKVVSYHRCIYNENK
jgi:PIF1-like helicase